MACLKMTLKGCTFAASYCKQSHLETSVGPEWSEMRRGWGSLGCAWQVRQKIWVWLGTSWTSQVTLGRPCLHIQYPLYFTKRRKMAKEWTSLTAHCMPAGEPHPQALSMKKTPCPRFRSHMYNFRLGRRLCITPDPTIYPRNWNVSV